MNKMCDEATAFACELLMPKNAFVRFVDNESNNVGDIATHFQVPSAAVRIRAGQLGYGGHELGDGYMKRFNVESGSRMPNPYDPNCTDYADFIDAVSS